MILKAGYGYWDVTSFPYGGCFRRAAQNTPVEVTEDMGIKYGYKAKLNGADIISKYDSFMEG